ncbi:MAG: molybdenum cofactor biosynthesis protein MoaE [Bradyrhizobiaceae bacterium]|nr:MAG: molybdenum cofactor biosynthesis protein MoaE [Bradyrhizobiaceae bacterium]
MTIPVTIRVQEDDFDVAKETAALIAGRPEIGAIVSFIGVCRSGEGDAAISEMTLEHYPGMAEEEIARHANDAIERWPLNGLTVIHRYGRVVPGDNIVLVLAASVHREAAFVAVEFLMDYLKSNAPFWKSEKRADGSQEQWVEARKSDDDAAARWKE